MPLTSSLRSGSSSLATTFHRLGSESNLLSFITSFFLSSHPSSLLPTSMSISCNSPTVEEICGTHTQLSSEHRIFQVEEPCCPPGWMEVSPPESPLDHHPNLRWERPSWCQPWHHTNLAVLPESHLHLKRNGLLLLKVSTDHPSHLRFPSTRSRLLCEDHLRRYHFQSSTSFSCLLLHLLELLLRDLLQSFFLVQQRVYLALCGLIPRLPISVPLELRYDLLPPMAPQQASAASWLPSAPRWRSSSSSNVHHFFFDHLGKSHAILLSISSFFNQGSEHRMCLLTESPPSSQSIFKLLLQGDPCGFADRLHQPLQVIAGHHLQTIFFQRPMPMMMIPGRARVLYLITCWL